VADVQMKEVDWNNAVTLASPYPYALGVTIAPDGKPNIIGLGWWSFCSISPPMLAIAVGKPRYSHDCLEYLGEFTLCFPAEDQAEGAWLCGTKSGRDVDKFEAAGFTPVPSKEVRPPLIAGSTAAFECRVTNKVEAGDYIIYIAEILAQHATPGKEHHVYTVHYRKMLSLGSDGYANFDL
jgi:flavin reductase (DIM6/NTAB) family NADH-FMN oxidoreductase RutF